MLPAALVIVPFPNIVGRAPEEKVQAAVIRQVVSV
jgi:hypothetical protein